jgi:hypothetical protein
MISNLFIEPLVQDQKIVDLMRSNFFKNILILIKFFYYFNKMI